MSYSKINMAKKYFYYQNDSASINKDITLNDEQTFWRKHSYLRFQMMKQARQMNGREDDWDKYEKQYRAWRPPKGLEWQSNIVPPFTTSVVESAMSELIDQTLQPQVGARKKEDVPKATVINFIKDYTWEIGYGDVELYKGIKQALVKGTTIWQDYYWQDKRQVKYLVKYNPQTGREEYEEREVFDFDDCYGETVQLEDIWVDPDARSFNTGPYKANDTIRRYVMHIDNFRKTFANTKWDKFGLVMKIKPSGDQNYYQYYQPPQGIDPGNYVEVLWHWLRNPDQLVLLANDVPFFIGPNPYNHKQLPFGRGVDVLEPFSFYGRGEPELLESIQDELTTSRRMRLDRQKMDIYKMIFVSNRETLTDQDLIPAPMKPIYLEDIQNVQAFEYGDVNPSAYREEALLKEDGVRVTGIDDRAQSVAPTGGTATEAAIMKEATLKRLRMKIWLLSRTLLTEQVQLRVPNIIQFYQLPKVSKIVGTDSVDQWVKVKQAHEEGRLIEENGEYYEKEYRTIVTKDKKLELSEDGELIAKEARGDNFFTVTPQLLVPSAMGFNYKLSAEPTFPLSKPMMQQKVNELFQHPVMRAAMESGYLDVAKISDKMLDLNDFEPTDFHADKQAQPGQGGQPGSVEALISPEAMIARAEKENAYMMDGDALTGTPFATPEHTLAHVEFMRSERFKETVGTNVDIVRIFTRHILEEAEAQKLRSAGLKEAGGAAGPLPQMNMIPAPEGAPSIGGQRATETQSIMGGDAKAAQPNRQLGPEGVPDLMAMMGGGQ